MQATLDPTAEVVGYRPQTKQEQWHVCPSFESGFGGAKGPGKSLALLNEALRYVEHPRYAGIIFRRTYKRLEELIERAKSIYPYVGGGGTWNEGHFRWSFPSGARILFRHCEHEDDKRDYQGHEYQFMGFDQLEEFTETQYTYLLAQCRSGVVGLVPYTRATFNPGGVGHGWVKRRFINHGTRECAPWYPISEETGKPLPSRCFHFSTIDDNPAIMLSDPGYIDRLDMLPPDERRAMKYGDWEIFTGQMFSEFSERLHVVPTFDIPEHWPRWASVDYGMYDPWVCHWYAKSPPGTVLIRDGIEEVWERPRVFVYRETWAKNLVAQLQALRIRVLSHDEHINFVVADPSMWRRESNGLTIADEYLAAGVPLTPGQNDRLMGVQRVHRALAAHELFPPELQIMRCCPYLVRSLPELVRDTANPEDVDTDGDDHPYDDLRYALLAADGVTRKVPEATRARMRGHAEGRRNRMADSTPMRIGAGRRRR